MVSVSFRLLVGKLRRVHEFPVDEFATRQDYPSGVTVAWTVIDPIDGSVFPADTSTRVTPRASHRASCSARSSASRYVIVADVTLVVRNCDTRRAYPYGTDVGSGLRVRRGSCHRVTCA